MLARLRVQSGAHTNHLDLKLPTVLGRGGTSKVKLPASTVSRQHCEVYEYEGQIAIRDLGSSNGTYVNGHPIDGPTFITADDRVQVGPLVFSMELLAASAPAPAPVPASSPVGQPEIPASIPDLKELPPAADQPAEPTPSHAEDVMSAAASAQGSEGDSVLQYTAPKDETSRSFIGIEVVGDDAAPAEKKESEAPVIADGEEAPRAVEADESALQNFFDHLE